VDAGALIVGYAVGAGVGALASALGASGVVSVVAGVAAFVVVAAVLLGLTYRRVKADEVRRLFAQLDDL
jgi:hypothetical protein